MGGVWNSPEECRKGLSSLIYLVLADLVLVLHFAFILLVMLGAVLVLRWRRIAWIHVPCALWGAWIEFRGVDLYRSLTFKTKTLASHRQSRPGAPR